MWVFLRLAHCIRNLSFHANLILYLYLRFFSSELDSNELTNMLASRVNQPCTFWPFSESQYIHIIIIFGRQLFKLRHCLIRMFRSPFVLPLSAATDFFFSVTCRLKSLASLLFFNKASSLLSCSNCCRRDEISAFSSICKVPSPRYPGSLFSEVFHGFLLYSPPNSLSWFVYRFPCLELKSSSKYWS